jgi:hypothetical protein
MIGSGVLSQGKQFSGIRGKGGWRKMGMRKMGMEMRKMVFT